VALREQVLELLLGDHPTTLEGLRAGEGLPATPPVGIVRSVRSSDSYNTRWTMEICYEYAAGESFRRLSAQFAPAS
jgi:hypothetical protein